MRPAMLAAALVLATCGTVAAQETIVDRLYAACPDRMTVDKDLGACLSAILALLARDQWIDEMHSRRIRRLECEVQELQLADDFNCDTGE